MAMTICKPVNGIGGIDDLEVFDIFNIEIDEQGHDLWEFRKVKQKKKSARERRQDSVPTQADLMCDKIGRAGDESRIQALASFYQEQLENKTEKSAFLSLTD